MTTRLILDTDIGSDIDDAIALAYLLAQPACELLGITTVSGEAVKRAMLASALCKAAGKDVPIFPGREEPFLGRQLQPSCPQAEMLGRWAHENHFPTYQAVHFLQDTIRSHPGEIVLLTIGPLTNIAALFAVDPQIPSLLRGMVSMCGRFMPGVEGREALEWNAMLDPHATAMVYRNAPVSHRSVGLDVTTKVTMPTAEVCERFRTACLLPLLDLTETWLHENQTITFHDPLAAITVFDNTICHYERGHVKVNIIDEQMGGRTIWHTDALGPHEVAVSVDGQRFFESFFSVFAKP
jgi:purine nucleosidase